MGHTLLKKREGNRMKMVYYAPHAVREFIRSQAEESYTSQSEIVVRLIQDSSAFKRKGQKHART